MNLFDLPLEIVREIIKQAVVRTGGNRHDQVQLQLINSNFTLEPPHH